MSTGSAVKLPANQPQEAPPPHRKIVVVDIGKKKRKQVNNLAEGHGKLMDRVTQVVSDLEASGQVPPSSNTVVIVVQKKPKKVAKLY